MATLTKKELLENEVFKNASDDTEIFIPDYRHGCMELCAVRTNIDGDILLYSEVMIGDEEDFPT